MCREVAPNLLIHVSTQANTTNWSAVRFWKECGAERVVLAREVPLRDVKDIYEKTHMELEGFVHGAMCISYSGRCLLSNYFTQDRDSNHGECVQCCRFKYSLVEEKRPGEYFPVMEDERGTYIMNSKDMCLIGHLPALYEAGLSSLKVEGRMKSLHYVATVIKTYREAMDAYEADPEHFSVRAEWLEELEKISHRPYTTGFYFGRPDENDQVYAKSSNVQTHDFIGLVKSYDEESGRACIEQRNFFKVGQDVEFLMPHGPVVHMTVTELTDGDGKPVEAARHAQETVYLKTEVPLEPYAMMRRKSK